MLKKKLKEIITPGIVSVSPDTLVSEAVSIMRSKMISCILVMDDGTLQGIFTERNIVSYVAEKGFNFALRKIRELMSSPVMTVQEDKYVYEAYNVLVTNQIRHLVVTDDQENPVGVVTQSNLIRNIGYEYFVELKRISQIMSTTLFTVSKDAELKDILLRMAQQHISCILVVEDGRPLGIITERDVSRLVINGEGVSQLTLEDVMSSPVITIPLECPVYEAADMMNKKKIRRLVVVDEEGKTVGLTTQSDIVRGLESKYVEILKGLIREKDNELQQTLENLYEKSAYLDNILHSSIDMGIVATDINLVISYFNPAAQRILGYRPAEVIGKDLHALYEMDDIEPMRIDRALGQVSQKKPSVFTFTRSYPHTEDRVIQGRFSGIWDKESQLIGYVLMLRDITERQKAEETIRHMAYHDILTGLPNRVLFHEHLSLELARAERNKNKIALMMIDLDKFKDVNDTMGHQAGDRLLQAVSERLDKMLRKSDTIARVGGDEFLLILSDIKSEQDAVYIAEKILQQFKDPFRVNGENLDISASIGISFFPDHGSSGDELVKIADWAMYKAKEMNRKNQMSNLFVYPKKQKD